MLVRLVAVAFMGWTLLDVALYWFVCSHDKKTMEMIPCVIKSLPALVGLVILIRSKSLAEWISNLLDN